VHSDIESESSLWVWDNIDIDPSAKHTADKSQCDSNTGANI